MEENKIIKPDQFRIETPIGSVESDSGNHAVDILSVLLIIGVVIIGKKLLGKWF